MKSVIGGSRGEREKEKGQGRKEEILYGKRERDALTGRPFVLFIFLRNQIMSCFSTGLYLLLFIFLCTALYNRYQNSETFLYSIFNGLYFYFCISISLMEVFSVLLTALYYFSSFYESLSHHFCQNF